MEETLVNALGLLAEQGDALRTNWRFDWPVRVQQAVFRLRFEGSGRPVFSISAVAGGASSGKSTLFNNLLEGHLVSRIAAAGHTTLGPILAAHETHRGRVEELLRTQRLTPGLRHVATGIDGNVAGEPDAVATCFHCVDAIRDVLLFDLPDFTSEAARREGDITMALLPWFDRLVAVVDHERWFDRQAISGLRDASLRCGQQRWAVFNRTQEGPLRDEDRTTLMEQGRRLQAEGITVLEFRRGRGFRRFPPDTLADVRAFLSGPAPERSQALLGLVAEAAHHVLNQNAERGARLKDLRESLEAAVRRTLPSTQDCLAALMTAPERRQLEPVTRILRLGETRAWLIEQTRRLYTSAKQIPVVGVLVRGSRATGPSFPETADRTELAELYYQAIVRRQIQAVQRVTRGSAFWEEIRRWTGQEPSVTQLAPAGGNPAERDEVRRAAEAFDAALEKWLEKVNAECAGLAPRIKGAIGLGGVGLAIVLLGVPGPVAALTLASVKGAIAASLGQLATAAGAGALLGKPLGRLATVVQEKLLGSEEFAAVREAAHAFRALLEGSGMRLEQAAFAEASRLVLSGEAPLARALERVARHDSPRRPTG